MHLAALLLAGLYGLPDGPPLPAPTAAQQARIEGALETLRRAEGEEVGEWAMRDLALVGEPALPFVVERLNAAGAGERLLLLAAVRRVPRAAPLLEQARADPHPAVRAFFAAPPRPPGDGDVRLLARRYVDLLALAEEKRRVQIDRDLEGTGPPPFRPNDSFEAMRARMRDRTFANEVQAAREELALRFARVGGQALRSGDLLPSLDDPVFVAYLALLREESLAFHAAAEAFAAAGGRVAPALEAVLRRGGQDPRKIARLLAAVDPGRARTLLDGLAALDEDTQRALVGLAAELLDGAALLPFLERAALAADGSVRRAALDRLLLLAPPAGRDAGRTLLDPARFGAEDFRRAAQLLARAGDLEPLLEYATLRVPADRTEASAALSALREACRAALRDAPPDAADAVAARLLREETRDARLLGLELARDFDRLRERLRDPDYPELGREAARRLLDEFGRPGLDAVLPLLGEPALGLGNDVARAAARLGDVDRLLALARGGEPEAALRELARMDSIDAAHEEALLALHRDAPPELRHRVMAALLPLGTARVRDVFLAAGADALSVLAARSESGQPLPFSVPLLPHLADADDLQLSRIGLVALAQPSVEPGLLVALLDAWDAREPLEGEEGRLEESATEQKARLVAGLAQSQDAEGARVLFGRLAKGEVDDATLVLGILKAAVRHVPPERLRELLPVLREQARAAYPMAGKEPPPPSALRDRLLVGGMRALACARVEEGIAFACDLLLDPSLQPAAFDWEMGRWLLAEALDSLRLHPGAAVREAFRGMIAAAEADGRLARLEPAHLDWLVRHCGAGRSVGRRLDEVALELCGVLERLPSEEDVGAEKVTALVSSGRYADAAAAAETVAGRKRALGITAQDGPWTPERFLGRAILCRALAAREPAAFREAMPAIRDDPYLCYLAGWYTLFTVPDLGLAAEAAERAVQLSGGLDHLYRDLLAAVRNAQGRPDDALELLDPRKRLPVDRTPSSGFHLLFEAKAHALRGDLHRARIALDSALAADRRTLQHARNDRTFDAMEDVFRAVEEAFLDGLFTMN